VLHYAVTLQVPFEQFAKTAERLTGAKVAFLSRHPGGTLATAAKPEARTIVASLTTLELRPAREALTKAGLEVLEGVWSFDGQVEMEANPLHSVHIAAVAYQSAEAKPGLWVDAYATLPTEVFVLRAMYEEFTSTGQMDEVAFEEFMRLANPNVVILTPAELSGFLKQKDC